MLVYRDGNKIGVNVNISRKDLGYTSDDIITCIRVNGKDFYLNYSTWVYERGWMHALEEGRLNEYLQQVKDKRRNASVVDKTDKQVVEEGNSWYHHQVKAAEEDWKESIKYMDKLYTNYLEELKRRTNDR